MKNDDDDKMMKMMMKKMKMKKKFIDTHILFQEYKWYWCQVHKRPLHGRLYKGIEATFALCELFWRRLLLVHNIFNRILF